jgi:capsular exopolysaccharide synthesis family protein
MSTASSRRSSPARERVGSPDGATPVNDRRNRRAPRSGSDRGPEPGGIPDQPTELHPEVHAGVRPAYRPEPRRAAVPAAEQPALPRETLPAQGSAMFSGKAGMMRLPETIESGRRAAPPPGASEPRSARASWVAPVSAPQNRALVKGQTISLTDTAISAMPSESRDLVVLHHRDGAFASEVRILATRLADLRTRLGYKSFLITSAGDDEGKTVVASNLALVMSEDSERKVALVDANFRNPRAADLFNLDKSRGLLAALAGQLPLSSCVARVLGRNLVVLHAGGEHVNPAAVLSSPKFKSLLAELYQAVDFMIVDAPSALPHADVPLLTQHVDAVIVVGAAHRTNRKQLDKALDTIGRSRVVGSVFLSRARGAKKKSA